MRVLIALLILSMVTACGDTVSNVSSDAKMVACPQETVYTKEQQLAAMEELADLPPHGLIRGLFMPDYGRLRDQSRACRGEKVPETK